MSGHSKWAQIKRSKGVLDSKRGAVFTRHAKAITVAARAGGDPDMNPTLRLAIDKAKADNMPKDNIERAIRRGTGEEKGAAMIEEVQYEVIGPDGSMGIVTAHTDNRNRTAADIRHLADENDGKVAAPGSVSFQFTRAGYISMFIDKQPMGLEELELLSIDLGAIDVQAAAGVVEVYTQPQDLMRVRASLVEKGCVVEEAKPFLKPSTTVRITDLASAKRVVAFFEALEEHDDVSSVNSNVDLAEEVIAQLS